MNNYAHIHSSPITCSCGCIYTPCCYDGCPQCEKGKAVLTVASTFKSNSQKDNQELSKCCNAPVIVEGLGDFHDKDEVGTMHYECTKCKQPCDVVYNSNPLVDNQATSESWEEEFGKYMEKEYGKWKIGRAEVKDFIRELLQSQKDRLKKKVEGLTRVETGGIIGVELSGWNKALEEVLKLFE